MQRVLLVSGDKQLNAQVKQALEVTSTVMSADPAVDNVEDVASQFQPQQTRQSPRPPFCPRQALGHWQHPMRQNLSLKQLHLPWQFEARHDP